MCQKDHELAALGTMSWPEFMTMRPVRVGFFLPRAIDCDHQLAGTASLGSIKWPKLRATNPTRTYNNV